MTARAFLTSTPPYHPDPEKRQPKKEIPIDEIVMFRAEHKYVDAYDRDGTAYILDDYTENRIRSLYAEYADLFIEVRRGCLVRKTEIRHVTTGGKEAPQVVTKTDLRVPISRRNVSSIRRFVAEFRASLKESVELAEQVGVNV